MSTSSVTDMPGCRITTESRDNSHLKLFLQFKVADVKTEISPQFTVNGAINFDFKVERRNRESFALSVRFQKKRQNDILNYCITFTNWNNKEIKFEAIDDWYIINSNGFYNDKGNISVKVQLKTLSSPCASLYEDTELADFKLVGDDGYVLVHKAIAAAHSPFYKNMFVGKWKETTEGFIEVPGISKETLEEFKEYLYLGTCSYSCVTQLLLLSKFYMMEDLEKRCYFIIRAELTKDNILEFLEFAVTNKQTRLVCEIIDAVQQGDIKVDESEEFQKYLL